MCARDAKLSLVCAMYFLTREHVCAFFMAAPFRTDFIACATFRSVTSQDK
jgi:hypothetical protein